MFTCGLRMVPHQINSIELLAEMLMKTVSIEREEGKTGIQFIFANGDGIILTPIEDERTAIYPIYLKEKPLQQVFNEVAILIAADVPKTKD